MNASPETWQLGNQAVQVSHLEKVYWPQTGFTKGELLELLPADRAGLASLSQGPPCDTAHVPTRSRGNLVLPA